MDLPAAWICFRGGRRPGQPSGPERTSGDPVAMIGAIRLRALPPLALFGHAGAASRCPFIGLDRKWPDHGQNDANDPTETWATLASRSAKLNHCAPFRWSQFLLNPHDARESASLKHLARQCDCRRGGAADKARG
jgi:hypothetical protein